MRKTLLLLLPLIAIVIYTSSCRKCYHCHNDCVLCTKTFVVNDTINDTTVVTHAVIDTNLLCKDAFNSNDDYQKAIFNDTSAGFICPYTNPTYTHDFCVGKSGEQSYPEYWNKGGRAECDPK